jgi:hypothetical protein
MPKCIYCHDVKDESAFNREHVIPEAFGTFEQNMVLHHVVCETCNTYFADHLEIKLARDSIEGLNRYKHNVKRPERKTAFGRAGLLQFRIDDGGFHHGAQMWWGPSDDGKSLVPRPVPQIGVCRESGENVWFWVDKLPTRSELPAHGFPRGTRPILKPFGVDPAEAEALLREKGYDPSPVEELGSPLPGALIEISISGVVNRVLMRCIAKIAFNYLTYHYEPIARLDQFDAVRLFIRDDIATQNPVSLSEGEFLAGLPADRAPLAHGVGVSWHRGQVVGQVTLFFQFHYRIVLADGGFLFPPFIVDKGHLFDPINRQILEVTSDPTRGRPIKVPPLDGQKSFTSPNRS